MLKGYDCGCMIRSPLLGASTHAPIRESNLNLQKPTWDKRGASYACAVVLRFIHRSSDEIEFCDEKANDGVSGRILHDLLWAVRD